MRSSSIAIIAAWLASLPVVHANEFANEFHAASGPHLHSQQAAGCGWSPTCCEPVPHRAMHLWQSYCHPPCVAAPPAHVCPPTQCCPPEPCCPPEACCQPALPVQDCGCGPCHECAPWPSLFHRLFYSHRHGAGWRGLGFGQRPCGLPAPCGCEVGSCGDGNCGLGVHQLGEPGFQSWTGAGSSQEIPMQPVMETNERDGRVPMAPESALDSLDMGPLGAPNENTPAPESPNNVEGSESSQSPLQLDFQDRSAVRTMRRDHNQFIPTN